MGASYTLVVAFMFIVPGSCLLTQDTCTFNPLFLEGTCSAHYTDPASILIENVFLSLAEADCNLGSPCDYPPHYDPTEGEEFDFIVVGAGSAGSVVANRLSEVAEWTVLLIEAGGDPPKTAEVPALFSLLADTNVDWQYKTSVEEPNCLGLKGSQCKFSRGKMLGGCSSINGHFYVRGNAKDYDRWEVEGNVGWGYRDVLPYFKKSEDMRSPELKCTPDFFKYHGIGGPLKVEDFNIDNLGALPALLGSGLSELGYFFNPDCTGKFQSGLTTVRGTLEDGRRCSTAKAFLSPIKNRNNFKVSKNALVTRIMIDAITKVAYGVELINEKGNLVKLMAKKEIVISGGAINSPQLLMLSGVGPREHLLELGINGISDLPVGKNLQDQPVVPGIVIGLNYSIPEIDLIKNTFNFLLKYNNSFSGAGLSTFFLFADTETAGMDYPDISCYFIFFNKNSIELLGAMRAVGFNEEIQKSFIEINTVTPIILLVPSILNVKSRGSIQLQSKNPTQYPKITCGYLSDQRDIDILIKAIDFLRGLTYTKTFSEVGARLHDINIESCLEFPFDSRPYKECFLRHLAVQGYHEAGTCHMGPPGHPDTVVDPQLRVVGVDRLRVIDASVMPTLIRGNPNAPIIMIAEKGSDLIKQTWLSSPYSVSEVLRVRFP